MELIQMEYTNNTVQSRYITLLTQKRPHTPPYGRFATGVLESLRGAEEE